MGSQGPTRRIRPAAWDFFYFDRPGCRDIRHSRAGFLRRRQFYLGRLARARRQQGWPHHSLDCSLVGLDCRGRPASSAKSQRRVRVTSRRRRHSSAWEFVDGYDVAQAVVAPMPAWRATWIRANSLMAAGAELVGDRRLRRSTEQGLLPHHCSRAASAEKELTPTARSPKPHPYGNGRFGARPSSLLH